jgi:SAM-dependent methyltransferase
VTFKNRLAYLLVPIVGLKHTIRHFKSLIQYYSDLSILQKQQKESTVEFPIEKPYPCLEDRYSESGTASGHYFHQDLLVAQKIFSDNPDIHVDIGSRVDGFIAHVASFREIEVFDIREFPSSITNVKPLKIDLIEEISEELTGYCDSLSCLHALEHFGLGRYGDPVDFDGFLKGLENLNKVLRTGGKFYLSVPIGPQRIEFNAHRVFSVEYLLFLVSNNYQIDSFAYVDDNGDLFKNVDLRDEEINRNFGCEYGCGIFELTKI